MDKEEGKKKFGAERKGFDPKKKLSRTVKTNKTEPVPEKKEAIQETSEPLEKLDVPKEKVIVQKQSAPSKELNKAKPKLSKDRPAFAKKSGLAKNSPVKRAKKEVAKKHYKVSSNEGAVDIRLNKFIANSGLCSRREADELIKSGVIKVNGIVVTEMGVKVKPTDKIQHGDQYLRGEKMVYLLLNKPKDFITSLKDKTGRKTVLDLIDGACKERVFPVGSLDRNSTGLLMMTNDSNLASKLTHPKNKIRKIYQVVTEETVSAEDLKNLQEGVKLDDGLVQAVTAAYGEDKKTVGIEMQEGKNRAVRRMFDALGYKVKKLDRVLFADLTKKQIPRGEWRMLTEKEVDYLRML